ncbi:MAG: hypothetical protein KA886_06605 [Candidatus Cloacimonetes bacterium]|nr:hypothetical protein [Candidatus Cloacimonadota bacterium]
MNQIQTVVLDCRETFQVVKVAVKRVFNLYSFFHKLVACVTYNDQDGRYKYHLIEIFSQAGSLRYINDQDGRYTGKDKIWKKKSSEKAS